MAPPDTGDAAPDPLRLSLERNFRYSTLRGPGSPLITQYPAEAAEVAMDVVGPVLEDRDAEIARLKERVAELEAQAARWRAVAEGTPEAS